MILVPNMIEKNGKTVRQNNMEILHKIPLKTLVALIVTPDNDYCYGKYKGIRAYVVSHDRDCDGTPLYGLSLNRDLVEDESEFTAFVGHNHFLRGKITSGIGEEDLRIVEDI